MTAEIPFCLDCAHFKLNPHAQTRCGWCEHPNNMAYAIVASRVDGSRYQLRCAEMQRILQGENHCGLEGRWFQRRTP